MKSESLPDAAAAESRLNVDVNRQVLDNLGIARIVARRCLVLFGPVLELDDLTQEANLALLRAARYYQPQYGAAFSTYAYRCCWRACTAVMRPLLRRAVNLPRRGLRSHSARLTGQTTHFDGLMGMGVMGSQWPRAL